MSVSKETRKPDEPLGVPPVGVTHMLAQDRGQWPLPGFIQPSHSPWLQARLSSESHTSVCPAVHFSSFGGT